jgi:hypothetical protein
MEKMHAVKENAVRMLGVMRLKLRSGPLPHSEGNERYDQEN